MKQYTIKALVRGDSAEELEKARTAVQGLLETLSRQVRIEPVVCIVEDTWRDTDFEAAGDPKRTSEMANNRIVTRKLSW